jgi:hypothetical protein
MAIEEATSAGDEFDVYMDTDQDFDLDNTFTGNVLCTYRGTVR